MTPRLICALFVAIAACEPSSAPNQPGGDAHGSDSGLGGGGDASTVDALLAGQACASEAAARCGKLMSCSPADLSRRFGDVATCEAREALACSNGVAAPDTGTTPGTALACGEALTALTCADFLGKDPPAACFPPGPNSGTCAFAAQCSTSFCSVGANALCGVCQAQPAVGASCAASGCGQTLVCDGNDHLCAMPVAANGACNPTLPCDHGLACVGDTKTTNGTCKPVLTTVGAACDQTRKTRANCSGDDGLTCNTNTNKCVAQPLVAAGAPCGPISGVQTDCSAGASCVIPSNKTIGTCVAPAIDGAACDTKAGPDCLTPARCIPAAPPGTAGTCQLPGSKSC
jgi:hypothetical protein